MKIAIYTLGCKVNQCDADALVRELCARGHDAFHTRGFDCAADVFIINTCTVTHTSDKKSRQMLRRAKKTNASVMMCGCLKNSHEIKKSENRNVPFDVDFIFDARTPQGLFDWLSRRNNAPVSATTGTRLAKTRSFIKIQDGCDRFCSYCIVPYVRGAVKSRPLAEISDEAQALIADGALEIVLTGIQAAAYGQDIPSENSEFLKLPDLIKKIAALDGLIYAVSRLCVGQFRPHFEPFFGDA